MRVLITSPITPISPSPYSHRAAPSEIFADQMRHNGHDVTINYKGEVKDYSSFDRICVYHGNDFSGGLNIFGGIEKLPDPEGLYNLFSFDPQRVYSIGIDMPRYDLMIQSRMKPEKEVSEFLNKIDWPAAAEVCKSNSNLPVTVAGPAQGELKCTKMVIGDSHAISMYRPGWNILSIPFKTLHGALETGLDSLARDNGFFLDGLTELEIYFGNIDIRHHLCRQPDPKLAAQNLVDKLLKHVDRLEFDNEVKIRIYEPLPIESVDRKVPKTGFYKGTPFFGSWSQRNDVRSQIIERLSASGRIIRWTGYLKTDAGELDTRFMEKPRSVHLARAHYPFWTGLENTTTTDLGDFL